MTTDLHRGPAVLTRAPSVLAIPKASSAEHAADNAAAGRLSLSESELAALDKAFPRGPKPRGLRENEWIGIRA